METKIYEEEDNKTIVDVVGRIDTTTVPDLEKEILPLVEDVSDLVFNFEKLEYISSAGLRLLLSVQKKMNQKNGKFVLRNINEFVQEVLDMTGFADIIAVE